MNTLYFITSNQGKFREVIALIPEIKQLDLPLEELQSLDAQTVIEHKLAQAATQHDGEFIVEDTSLELASMGGLPGTFIKWFLQSLGVQGLADMALCYEDRSALAKVTIGYRNSQGDIHYFVGEIAGQIVAPRGNVSPFGWNSIFQPEGESRTFAEMSLEDKNGISMRGIATKKLKQYLDTTLGHSSQI